MFLQSFKVKRNNSLKRSEVKKLKQRIQAEFSDTNPEVLISSKSNVNILKLVTHANFQTNVYCVKKIPMFFENEENKLVPTVYSLWQVADLLPYFTTHADVLPKLSNGADLILPDVVPQGTGMSIYGHYKKAQLVAINLTCNKLAIGVGFLCQSSNDLYMSGGHGVAVKILHLFGDKLWGHEPSLAQQVPFFKDAILTDNGFPDLGPKIFDKKIVHNMEEEFDSLGLPNTPISDQVNNTTEGFCENTELDGSPEYMCENTPEKLLKHAFLSALKNNGKNLKLPILTSNFYRLYVVPESDEALDLKKTKYKKLSNFLNEMIEQGFVVIREETKRIDKIISVDFEHPELVNFITDVKKPKCSDVDSSANPLFHSQLTELYTITNETAPLFTRLYYKRGSGIAASRIKKVIKEYINKQNLVLRKEPNDEDKWYILDECLETICNSKFSSLNNIFKSVISHMHHSYQMCSTKVIKGNKPLIQISRNYNVKTTFVSHIECYGIILTEFIRLCKKGAAAGATMVSVQNENREMLEIQGNQVRFVFNLLTEMYKIPQNFIIVLERARDRKKHKKRFNRRLTATRSSRTGRNRHHRRAHRDSNLHGCVLCKRLHGLQFCWNFLRMSPKRRKEVVQRHKYCVNCLAKSHGLGGCSFKYSCKKCDGFHYTLLHPHPRHSNRLRRLDTRRLRQHRRLPWQFLALEF